MLVLSRKRGQTIVLPELGVTFTVLETPGNGVRIGISAPPGVTVHREEVWQRIQASRGEESSEKIRCEEQVTEDPDPLSCSTCSGK